MAALSKSARLFVSVERTGKWVLSRDVPSDVVVQVGETSFCLHKFMLVAKCGNIRKLILESSETDLSKIELPDFPGGPEIFEKAAKFCYGENFEITVRHVAALRCAGEYLEMSETYCQGNLISWTEEFLALAALTTFSGAVAVLKSCEELMPMAAELEIVQRCLDVASLKFQAYNESNSPMRPPSGKWMEELSILSVDSFKQFMVSLKSRGARTQTLAATVMTYAERSLRELVRDRTGGAALDGRVGDADWRRRQRETLEGIVGTMPDEKTAFPVSFLCCLLRAAIFLDSARAVRGELERRAAAVLEHAAVDDLLAVGMGYEGERVVDHESVRKIVFEFAEKERKGSNSGEAAARGTASDAMQKVAKTVDLYLAEIATDGDLSISTFMAMAVLIPKSARTHDDDLYRAADIYLKAHPGLDEIDREKVCSIMDPLSLSYNARAHASQNKRLPVQVVLHALYYDQLMVRCEDPKLSDASITRNQVCTDVSLIRENESLRMELENMKTIVSDMQRSSDLPAATKTSKLPTFFASVSKTFGKLNPFRHGSKDTSQIESITCGSIDIAKPRKRRFSLS